MSDVAIAVRDLIKDYGSKRALNGVSLDIVAGEVYGLLGHNGAGKSTAVEILEGHRRASGGEVSVLGMDPGSRRDALELRDRIGIVLQTSGIQGSLTVVESIVTYGSCYSRRRPVDEVLELAGLIEQRNQRVGSLSGGQRRRVDFALGIVNYPEILFLDEPTTGFDPAARRSAWEVIRGLRTDGTTVLLTTHYLEEADELADRVGIIAHGEMVAEGTPSELVGAAATTTIHFRLPTGVPATAVESVIPTNGTVVDGAVTFETTEPTADVHRLTGWAVDRGIELDQFTVDLPSLEDMFLDLAGEAGSAGERV